MDNWQWLGISYSPSSSSLVWKERCHKRTSWWMRTARLTKMCLWGRYRCLGWEATLFFKFWGRVLCCFSNVSYYWVVCGISVPVTHGVVSYVTVVIGIFGLRFCCPFRCVPTKSCVLPRCSSTVVQGPAFLLARSAGVRSACVHDSRYTGWRRFSGSRDCAWIDVHF